MSTRAVGTWIGNAAAVLNGPWGAITAHAHQAGCFRQAAYEHAQRVAQAVTDAQAGGPSRAHPPSPPPWDRGSAPSPVNCSRWQEPGWSGPPSLTAGAGHACQSSYLREEQQTTFGRCPRETPRPADRGYALTSLTDEAIPGNRPAGKEPRLIHEK
jgi:hypothetical protein